jgi:uncharacterized phiE125 gp8 family phage protein
MSIDWTYWPDPPWAASSVWDWRPPWLRPARPGTMLWALQQITQSPVEPIDLAGAKSHLRVDISDDDAYIEWLIVAARDMVERMSGLSLLTQTWKLYLDRWPRATGEFWPWAAPAWTILLPRFPVQSVTSIQWFGSDGSTNTVASTDYIVEPPSRRPQRIAPAVGKSWPAMSLIPQGGVVVSFSAGFGAQPAVMPPTLRQAMLLLIGTWYENREDVVVDKQIKSIELTQGFKALLGLHMPALVG